RCVRATAFARLEDIAPGAVRPAPASAGGACVLAVCDDDGCRTLRYTEDAIAAAMSSFALAYPASGATRVPLCGGLAEHDNAWTALCARGAGLTLHDLGPRPDEDFLHAVQSAGEAWHSVRFDHRRTRLLGRPGAPGDPQLAAEHLVVDAAALTRGAIARLGA